MESDDYLFRDTVKALHACVEALWEQHLSQASAPEVDAAKELIILCRKVVAKDTPLVKETVTSEELGRLLNEQFERVRASTCASVFQSVFTRLQGAAGQQFVEGNDATAKIIRELALWAKAEADANDALSQELIRRHLNAFK